MELELPRRAIIYTRLSDAKNGASLKDQEKQARKFARTLGWRVGQAVTENDDTGTGTDDDKRRSHASAFRQRRVVTPSGKTEWRVIRPVFRKVLEDLEHGRADGLIVLDLDRLVRDPRDLEDLIDLAEHSNPRIPVESVTGSLRGLGTDADITMARIMVTVANKESRDKARRVASSHALRAAGGQYRGGVRPFGYESDGVTLVPDEAGEIIKAAEAVRAGISLRSVVADLRAGDVPTVTGAEWSVRSLRGILMRARNAGITVYQGEEVSKAGEAEWRPVFPEEEWRAVCSLLTNPARKTSPGNAPRHLGSLIYRCGVCDDGTTCTVSGRGGRVTYGCREHNHLRRVAAPLDALVTATLIGRMARPDARKLLTAKNEPDVTMLLARERDLQELLDEQARLHARRILSTSQLIAGTRELNGDLHAVQAELAAAQQPGDPAAMLAGQPDAAQIWAGLPLEQRRAILRSLLSVTVLPSGPGRQPGGGYFAPGSVDIEWLR